MPYKANAPRRHKFPKDRYRINNWPAYDAALVDRGDLTVWVTARRWRRGTRRRSANGAGRSPIPMWPSRPG